MARWSAKPPRDVPMVEREIGGEARERFESSWQSHHFEGVPQV